VGNAASAAAVVAVVVVAAAVGLGASNQNPLMW